MIMISDVHMNAAYHIILPIATKLSGVHTICHNMWHIKNVACIHTSHLNCGFTVMPWDLCTFRIFLRIIKNNAERNNWIFRLSFEIVIPYGRKFDGNLI